VFALGLAGCFKRWLFWVLFLIALALAWRFELRGWLRSGSGAWHFRSARHLEEESRLGKFLVFYLVFSILIAFLSALAPPIAWDSQVYHLTGPKLYIERGRITGGIDIPYLGFPQLVEMLFAAGLLLKGPAVARLMHFSYGILCLLALFAFSRRYFEQKVGFLSGAIFYAVPSVVLISTWAYVDVALIFYELAAFYALLRWRTDSDADSRWLLLSGLFCGMGLGVKYTGFALAFSLALAALWSVRSQGLRAMGLALASFGGAALLLALPWEIRNLFFTGNPFYPFFFGGIFWDEFRAWFYGRAGTGLAYTAPWRLLIAPLEMTVLGTEGKEGYEATVGPILVAVLPLLAFTWRSLPEGEKRILRPLLFICLVQYLLWLFGVGSSALLIQTRLLFPIFGLLALLAGYTVERLSLLNCPAFSVQWVVKAILVLTLSLTLLSSALTFAGDNPLKLLAGWETKDAYLHRHLGAYYEAIAFINKNLPAEAKVLFLWEPRSFYCQRECQPDAILDGFLHLAYRFQDADGIARYLKDEGFTHVLFHRRGYEHILKARFDPITPEVEEVLATLKREHLKPVYSDEQGTYVLYEVRTEWIVKS
ncbi:MAG: ArnT family glycosyltransferase, partial [Anaerolineae bacterium]